MKRTLVSAPVVFTMCLIGFSGFGGDDEVRQWQSELRRAKETDAEKAKQLSRTLIAHFDKAARELTPEIAKTEKAFKQAFDGWNRAHNLANEQKMTKAGEAWVELDQRFVLARTEQLDSYLQTDAEKTTVANELALHCMAMAEHENLIGLPTVTAWFTLMQGRSLVAIEQFDKAGECFSDVIRSDLSELTGDRRKHLTSLIQLAVRDLVKISARQKKYVDVESAMLEIQTNPALLPLLSNDTGKELLLDYAVAVCARADKTEDYENLIHYLAERIRKEDAQSLWRNRLSRAITDTVDRCREKLGAAPVLSSEELLFAALGCHAMGDYQAGLAREANAPADLRAKSLNEYERAVAFYRYAITTARSAKTSFSVRVNVEPQAWLQLSRCLVWLGQHYEAIASLQALMTTYAPEMRKQWLPELKRPDQKQLAAALNARLQEVDQNINTVVQKLVLQLADQNYRKNPDPLNQRLRLRCIKEAQERGYRLMDEEFLTAQQLYNEAKLLAVAARRAPRDLAAATATVDMYGKASAAFAKVREESPDVEAARFSACVALSNAYELLQRAGAPAEQSRALAMQALKALHGYEQFVGGRAASTDEDRARRARQQGFVLLAGTTLYCGAGEWENVIAAAEEYIKWEKASAHTEKSAIDAALLNQFRATLQLAARDTQKSATLLRDAERVIDQYAAAKPDDVSGVAQMLSTLAQRCAAAGQSERNAALQLRRLDLQEQHAQATTLDEWTRIVPVLKRSNDLAGIVRHGDRLLRKFDPKDEGCVLPDDEKFWQDYAAQQRSIIKYSDLNKWERCAQDHAALIDLMYDTRQGAVLPKGDAKRPVFDRVNQDLEKARAQIATIKRNYSDCATLKEGADSLVGRIEHEIEFRQKISAVRECLLDAALKVAVGAEESGNAAEAKRCRELGARQLEIIRRNGDSPSLQIKHAQLLLATGKGGDAINTLRRLRRDLNQSDMLYFTASKALAEACAAQKLWRDAAEYPEFVMLTAGLDSKLVKDNWPDMSAFLEQCYANGAPRPVKK